jgi:hypothetical protein
MEVKEAESRINLAESLVKLKERLKEKDNSNLKSKFVITESDNEKMKITKLMLNVCICLDNSELKIENNRYYFDKGVIEFLSEHRLQLIDHITSRIIQDVKKEKDDLQKKLVKSLSLIGNI